MLGVSDDLVVVTWQKMGMDEKAGDLTDFVHRIASNLVWKKII